MTLPTYISALLAQNDTGGSITNRWNFNTGLGTAASVSYSFLASVPAYYTGDNAITNFQAFSESFKTATRSALAVFSSICNVAFTETADSSSSMMRFGRNDQNGSSGYAYFPAYSYSVDGSGTPIPGTGVVTDLAGDVWIANGADQDAVGLGQWGWHTLVHEIGCSGAEAFLRGQCQTGRRRHQPVHGDVVHPGRQ